MVCDGFFTVCSTKNYSGKWQYCQKISFDSVAILVVKILLLISPFFIVAVSPHKTYAGNAPLLTLTKTDVTCKGLSNGTITSALTGGSGGAVNYTLTPGSISNTMGIFNSLAAGFYTVSADDAGIVTTASVTIGEPALVLSISLTSQTNVLCRGSFTGSVTVSGSGGTAGYNYSIDGGTVWQPGGTFGSLAAMAYTVIVKDANGCTKNLAVTITEPAAVLGSSITAQTNVLCQGNATGSVTVSGSGGTGAYNYSINGGATWQAGGTFGSLAAASYTVTVKDANGCTKNQVVTITEPVVALGSSITSQTNVLCKGNSTGSVTVAGSGGTGAYNYSINGGATWQAGGTFGSLAAASYTVTVKDANGCTKNQVVTITEPVVALGSSITSQTNVLCKGNSTGSVTVAGSGGTGAYNYSINGGATWQAGGTFGSLAAASYTVTVKDANGCTKNQVVTITEPVVALGSSITSQTNVLCKGNSTGSVTVAGSGGTGAYNYSINGGATWQAIGTFGSLAAAPYTVIVKDANGCTKNQPVTITEPVVVLSSAITLQTNAACKGGATGSVTVAGNGGTPAYSYSINGGATYQINGTFGALAAGSYTVRVKDANGCTVDQSVTITEPSVALSVVASSNSPVCSNASLNLVANGSGGTIPYTFSWTGPNAFTSTVQSPTIVNPPVAASGNYTVTIKDANNCAASAVVAVTINAAPIVTVNSSIATICQGGPVTLTSSSNIPPPGTTTLLSDANLIPSNGSTGGTPANAAWTTHPDNYISDGLTFSSNDNSQFYLSDSRSQGGGTTSTSTALQSVSLNTMAYSALTLDFWHYFRYQGPATEYAKVQVSTDGATWNDLTSYTSNQGTSTSFDHETISLTAYVKKPILYLRFYYYSNHRARYWAIDNVTLTGTLSAGTPVISWSSNPAGFSSNQANPPTVNPGVTTTYTVTYTNPATNCSNSASTTVTVNPKPVVTIQPNYCAVPGKIRLTAGGGTTYTWSTGETANPIFVDIADTYSVSSTNAFGCTGSASLPVSTELVTNGDFSAGNSSFTSSYGYTAAANGLFPEGLYAVGTDPTFYHSNFWGRDHTTNGGNFMIINGSGSNPPAVVWQETVSVMPNTDYYFAAWAISLNSVPPYANLQFNVNGVLVGTTAPLAARPANNNPPYDWRRFYGNWNSGTATTAVIQIVDLQTALGGNDFGLDDVSFGTLAPIPFVIAPTVNPTAVACSGKTMYLKSNITGGRAPVTYSWTGPNGFTSNLKDPVIANASVLHSGMYTLSVVDGYGCDPVIGTTNATILPTPVPVISSISGSGTVCPLAQEKYWTTPQANVSSSWTVTGGNIVGSSVKDSVEIKWSAAGAGLITLKSTNMVNLCDSTVTKPVMIQDLVPPTFVAPAPFGFCVENMISAAIVSSLLQINPTPDYFLFKSGSNALDVNPAGFSDNCTPPNQLVLHWKIDFGGATPPPSISGTGQPSAYGSDIIFPGDGATFLDVTHTITYWVVDLSGNESVHKPVAVTIHPRPVVSYLKLHNLSESFIYNTKS